MGAAGEPPVSSQWRRAAALIQSDLAKVGIEAKIVTYEWGEYIKRARAGEHDMILMGWVSSIADPDDLLRANWSCAAVDTGMNPSRRCQPDMDDLLRKGRTTFERSERAKYYRAAQALWHEQALAVPLAHSIQFTPSAARLSGTCLVRSARFDSMVSIFASGALRVKLAGTDVAVWRND